MAKSELTDLLVRFIKNRHEAFMNRELGKPKPWTKDPIIQQYRFCNMYRELDTVTRWIAKNWRNPNTDDQDVWFAMVVARYINEPATMEQLGYPVPWRSARWLNICEQLQEHKRRIFNAAYIIPTGVTKNTGPKHETLDKFFTHLWVHRAAFRPKAILNKKSHNPLLDFCTLLVRTPGVGTFMAGQVVADLKYTKPYLDCEDWWTFAVSGPGSRRGLNRVLGRGTDDRWSEQNWFEELTDLRIEVNKETDRVRMPPLHAQDLQNCLCEFDKWCRVYYKEGTSPKKRFDGAGA